jgi:hypothetical protein
VITLPINTSICQDTHTRENWQSLFHPVTANLLSSIDPTMAIAKETVDSDTVITMLRPEIDQALVVLNECVFILVVRIPAAEFLDASRQGNPIHAVIPCPEQTMLYWGSFHSDTPI